MLPLFYRQLTPQTVKQFTRSDWISLFIIAILSGAIAPGLIFAALDDTNVWKWMILYGALIVAFGQLCWFAGLRTANSAQTTLANSFQPIAAILMAYGILQEVPTMAQYLGGGIIFLGIILSTIGNLRPEKNITRTTV